MSLHNISSDNSKHMLENTNHRHIPSTENDHRDYNVPWNVYLRKKYSDNFFNITEILRESQSSKVVFW